MEIKSAEEIELMVSYFENYKFVKDASFEKLIETIRGEYWREQINTLRKVREEGSDQWKNLKKKLPAFTPCGTFKNERIKENLRTYSQILVLDFDKLDVDRIEHYRTLANKTNYTLASFISPSNAGFKVFVKVNSKLENHGVALSEVSNYYNTYLKIDIDSSGKDITRLCYISYDENGYYNADAEVFAVNIKNSNPAPVFEDAQAVENHTNLENRFEQVVKLTEEIENFNNGNRNNFINLLAHNCNRWGFKKDDSLNLIVNSEYCYDKKEVISTIYSAYKNEKEHNKFPLSNEDGTKKLNSLPVSNFASLQKVHSNPYLPDAIFNQLPEIIKKGTNIIDAKRERDMLFTGIIGVLSGCFSNVSGLYNGDVIYPNLYNFITAPPASGKGVFKYSKEYGLLLHQKLLKNNLKESNAVKKMLFLPGNASAAAIWGHLEMNEGIGIFFETEADHLSKSFKSDWGDFSDLLRMAFHHESFSQSRKLNNQYLEINEPKISLVVSGTPGQIQALTNSVENGLFSRILFYCFTNPFVWQDVSPENKKPNLKEHFKTIGIEAFKIIEKYSSKKHITFTLTNSQWKILNEVQGKKGNVLVEEYGQEASANAVRMGVMWFRIAMILTILNSSEDIVNTNEIICSDSDFEISKQLMDVYRVHIMSVFQLLLRKPKSEINGNIKEFYESLPNSEFKRIDAVSLGDKLALTNNIVDDYLSRLKKLGLVKSVKYGIYQRLELVSSLAN